jgi:hypothetical protein
MGKGTHIAPDREYHVPSPAAVSAGRSAPGNILFPPESDTTVPAGARGYLNYRLVGKFLHNKKNSITRENRKEKTSCNHGNQFCKGQMLFTIFSTDRQRERRRGSAAARKHLWDSPPEEMSKKK